MRVVVASGKGGTGKTMVATSLALVVSESSPAVLIDADVEAPNAALFLHPDFEHEHAVEQLVPVVSQETCTHCGRCAEVCQYHAIAALPKTTLVFEELCHSCGSCVANCPVSAISEAPRSIGQIEAGCIGPLRFAQGTMNIGEAMAAPVIRALKTYVRDLGWDTPGRFQVVDAPPGAACSVVEAMRGADVALLVTEPTAFGLHDLKQAVGVARGVLDIPVLIVLNKDGGGGGTGDAGLDRGSEAEHYCQSQALPIAMRIPLRREIAIACSNGTPLVKALPVYRDAFLSLAERLQGSSPELGT